VTRHILNIINKQNNSIAQKMTTLTIRQNFHEEVEAAINRQINMELRASYVYQSMVCLKKKLTFLLKDFLALFIPC
jgi:hypothetical protein